MISTFLGACQDPTPSPQQSFCNCLHSEIEHLEERDFLTFRNETVKLLSEIQNKSKECKREVTTSQQLTTTSRSITVHSRIGVRTHHHGNLTSLHSSGAASTDYHRTTCYSDCSTVHQPSGPSSSSSQTTSYVFVDFQTYDFQHTFSCTFTARGKSAQHFWIIHSLWSYSQNASVSTDGHTTAIFTLLPSTSTITSVIFHSS